MLTNDVGRVEFYTQVLGMTDYRENDRQVFMRGGPQSVALVQETL